MQNKYYLLVSLLFTTNLILNAQTTNVQFGSKESWLLERLEIKAQTNNGLNLSTVKPYMRQAYVKIADSIKLSLQAGTNTHNLTKTDQYNLERFRANNSEWSTLGKQDGWASKKASTNFYKNKANLIEVNEKDFFLVVNPAIQQQQSFGGDGGDRLFVNSKGLTARGLLANKIGFWFYATDNQERGPKYLHDYVAKNKAVPGNGFYKAFKTTGLDYFDARGGVSWNVTKYINMQFGYDKNFIGNGYRSLFLSDNANNNLYLKFNTRIWKFNYTNLFMELFPAFERRSDRLLPRKYASFHHFSLNATKWLNVGLFEGVVFGRTNRFDFSYLQPVIFLRSIEQQNGSPDNANIGFDIKANLKKGVQIYGQIMLDELNIAQIRKDKYWWANKQAYQLGIKYIDAFGIPNLDVQAELNNVRPFTYSHYDSVSGYNHYNQPLAHPMGANVREMVGIIRWQPTTKLYLMARGIYARQGLDSAGFNFGNNPILTNRPIAEGGKRLRETPYKMFDGVNSKIANLQLTASYELKENLFLEALALIRSQSIAGAKTNTTMVTLGLRWNVARREYDY